MQYLESFRVQGIKEDPNDSKIKSFKTAYEKLKGLLHLIDGRTKIKELKKFNPEGFIPRTLLLALSNQYHVRLDIAIYFQWANERRERKVYIIPVPSKKKYAEQKDSILK